MIIDNADMNFSLQEGQICHAKTLFSRAAKVLEFYTKPLPVVIFSAFLANYGRKSTFVAETRGK
jgi:hypothetical protein